MDSGFSTVVSVEQLQQILGNTPPPAEGTLAIAGSAGAAARTDHKHPRLTSASIATLDANGEATIMFTRTFAAMPAVICLLYEASNAQPVVFKVQSFVQDGGGNYTGCIIKGYRSSILPALSGIVLLGPLVSALANFNVFGGSPAGVQFAIIALQPSTV